MGFFPPMALVSMERHNGGAGTHTRQTHAHISDLSFQDYINKVANVCSSDQRAANVVKSSQVKIQNGGRLSAAFGAHRWRERSGGQISAQPAPLDSPESGHHPHLLDLDHRGAPGLQHRAFSGSLQYGNASPLQADDGSDRGPARGLLRWAKVSVGSGVRRRRASSARGPSPTSFWRFGLDKGTSIDFGQATRAAGAAAARVVEVVSAVRATSPRPPFLYMHARARALDTQVYWATRREKGVQGSEGWTAQAERQVRRQGGVNF